MTFFLSHDHHSLCGPVTWPCFQRFASRVVDMMLTKRNIHTFVIVVAHLKQG